MSNATKSPGITDPSQRKRKSLVAVKTMLYRTTKIFNADPEYKYPDVEVVWNEGWDVLYKLRQVELGTLKDPEMKKWLLG